jgi:polysaccharide biosynthesis transport protein
MSSIGSPAMNILTADSASVERIDELRPAIAAPILLQYWQVVQRWKWVILLIMLAAFVVGVVGTLLMTPIYSATARLEINREQKDVANVEGLKSSDAGRDLIFYQTQYSLLSARSLAQRVARTMNLSAKPEFFSAHGVDLSQGGLFASKAAAPISASERKRREDVAVQLLLANVAIVSIRGSSLVDIRYSSASAALSAQIANNWTQQFIAESMDRRFASTADARTFLEERLGDLRTRLESSERDVVRYAAEKGIVAIGTSKSVDGKTEVSRTLVSTDLEALNQALAAAKAERITAESRLGQRSGSNSEALTNGAIVSLRQRRAEVAADYAKMMVQFEPGYPAARALSEQLRNLDASIAREESRVSSSRATEYNEARRREANLESAVAELKARMGAQQNDSIQYNIYQREADTNRQLYDSLLQRYKEIGVAGVGTNNIAVVDAAKVPDSPSSPNLFLNLGLALLAGFGIAAVATFALDQIDEGLREPGQVNRLLHVPLLGRR